MLAIATPNSARAAGSGAKCSVSVPKAGITWASPERLELMKIGVFAG